MDQQKQNRHIRTDSNRCHWGRVVFKIDWIGEIVTLDSAVIKNTLFNHIQKLCMCLPCHDDLYIRYSLENDKVTWARSRAPKLASLLVNTGLVEPQNAPYTICSLVLCMWLYKVYIWEPVGAQWLRGRVLDSRPKGRGFEPHRRHCVVVLEQDTFILAKDWFNPGRPVTL